jgi:hypothetical protein
VLGLHLPDFQCVLEQVRRDSEKIRNEIERRIVGNRRFFADFVEIEVADPEDCGEEAEDVLLFLCGDTCIAINTRVERGG